MDAQDNKNISLQSEADEKVSPTFKKEKKKIWSSFSYVKLTLLCSPHSPCLMSGSPVAKLFWSNSS